MINDSVWKHGW